MVCAWPEFPAVAQSSEAGRRRERITADGVGATRRRPGWTVANKEPHAKAQRRKEGRWTLCVFAPLREVLFERRIDEQAIR